MSSTASSSPGEVLVVAEATENAGVRGDSAARLECVPWCDCYCHRGAQLCEPCRKAKAGGTDSTVRPIAVEQLAKADCNRLLTAWEHPLEACNRPFGQDFWGLMVAGVPLAVAVTTSTVSSTLTDERGEVWPRKQMVELARIARSPAARWAMRPLLRLWREVLVVQWSHWPVGLAVSYALPGTTGEMYRHDGWTFVRWVKPSSPGKGSTWAKASRSDTIADGRKGLWIWRYADRPALVDERGRLALGGVA